MCVYISNIYWNIYGALKTDTETSLIYRTVPETEIREEI